MAPPSRAGRPSGADESFVVVLLHGLALAVAAAALLLEHSLAMGTVGAVMGTLGAVMVSGFVARSRVRLYAVWLAASGAAAIGLVLGAWLVDGDFGPGLFGPGGAMAAGDLIRFGFLATAIALALRTTTARWAPFAVVELAVVALALASVVAAHRDGAINHPRALADWAWAHGYDPVKLLLYFGVGTVAALAVALLRERRGRGWRVLLHLLVAFALAGLTHLLITYVWPPTPPRGEGLGGKPQDGRGDGKGDRKAAGGGGKSDKSKDQIEELQFKNDYSSSSHDSPVAVILLHDDYSPPLGYYYFRQTAFSQYNGHRLIARTRDDMDKDILTDFPSRATRVAEPPREGPERKLITSTVALLADHVHPFGLESPIEYAPRESPDPTRFTRAYDVTSAALAMRYEDLLGKKAFGDAWSADLKAAYTELPEDPRYKQLADKIVDGTLRTEFRRDPFAEALAISAWLSKNSVYSIKSKHADEGDPTADFLFGDRIGYCVHFAHAAAFLLRARGLPARIAGGYVADEGRKGSGSTIMLRQKDAHAWAELHLDGFGWIIVDVSPERSLDPPDTQPDRDLQRMLGELARGQKPQPPPPKNPLSDGKSWVSAAQALHALEAALLAALLLLYSIKVWRRLAPSLASDRAIYRVAYRAALDRLAEVGHVRDPGETRERFATRLASVSPTLPLATRQHVGRAYGARRLAPPSEMRRLARRAADEAVARAPWWRTALGWLNPVSWCFTR